MAMQRLRPVIRTWDILATRKFYTGILGFTCTASSDAHGWAELECDAVAIMLSGPDEHEGDTIPSFSGSLYITCDDIDTIWNRVRDCAKVCYPIENFNYGMREFGIYDNNGYLLQFGMPLG